MINIIAELPDGCIPVSVWGPHPEGGSYILDYRVYGMAGRLPRFVPYLNQGEYMSEADKQEAKEHLGRAARQGKHAAKNAAKATIIGAELAAEETKEALVHAAGEVEDVVEDVYASTRRTAPKLSARGLAAISGDTGTGFLALAVSLYSGAIAYHKFRSAIQGRGRAVT